MNIYVINIITATKNKELYDQVGVNEYPLIIRCNNEDRLKEILSSKEDYIKSKLKTETLYNHGKFYIREICGDSIRDLVWGVKDVANILYNN